MLQSTHEKYDPQITQMDADTQKHKRLVSNLRHLRIIDVTQHL
jgi:hypothetical protein